MSKLNIVTELNDIYNININDCIVLCEIAEHFDEFTNNLREFSKGFKGKINLNHLYKHIKDGNKTNKKVRDFYIQNHKVLDTIHNYSYISNFLLVYYDNEIGKYNKEIMYMYEYIKNNIADKNKILFNLYRLQNLGFKVINFSENKNFDGVYEYDKYDDYYYYVDGNIEVIPSLEGFKYKTDGANYEMEFSRIPFHKAIITLNNLVFDSNLLPNNLSYDSTMKKILDLKQGKEISCKVLNDSVKLDYILDRITPALDKIDGIILDISKCKYREIAKEHIDNAKHAILELQWVLTNYECDLVKEGLIEKEILEEEKRVYKKRNS